MEPNPKKRSQTRGGVSHTGRSAMQGDANANANAIANANANANANEHLVWICTKRGLTTPLLVLVETLRFLWMVSSKMNSFKIPMNSRS